MLPPLFIALLIPEASHPLTFSHIAIVSFLVSMASMNWVMNVVIVLVSLWSGFGAAQQVPCYFIFGDSLVDNGNNNQLNSLAKANYLPYGIDFPAGPTGRFSNGKTTVDVVGEFFNLAFFF